MDAWVDYDAYIQSAAWLTKRAERMARDHARCVVCGDRAINVHHLTYERLGREDVRRDLVSVCRACHLRLDAIEKAERRERRSIKQGGRMGKTGIFRGWLDWRVLVLLALVTALLLVFVAVEGAGARSPGAFSGRAEVSTLAQYSQGTPRTPGQRVDRRRVRCTSNGGRVVCRRVG